MHSKNRLTLSCLILACTSHSEKCSMLVSCRSISVSHTRMLSRAVSNSSLWLMKCCDRQTAVLYDFRFWIFVFNKASAQRKKRNKLNARVISKTSQSSKKATFSLRMTAATLFCRLSHRLFPSCTISLRRQEESVRFSRARRRYCLLMSSSWVRHSCT